MLSEWFQLNIKPDLKLTKRLENSWQINTETTNLIKGYFEIVKNRFAMKNKLLSRDNFNAKFFYCYYY